MNWPFKRWFVKAAPPMDEAERSAREIEMPWISEAAYADFARYPESSGARTKQHAH